MPHEYYRPASLRDRRPTFAKDLMKGMLQNPELFPIYSIEEIAAMSVKAADALIKELQKDVET